MVGIDRQIPVADLDIIVGDSRPVLKPCIPFCSDLDRFVRKVAELGTEGCSGGQQ